MAYAQQSDITPARITAKELIQLTCDDSSNTVNTDVVQATLDQASAMVDSYCRSRYVTPLQASTVVLKCTVDIAVYLLFSRRRGGLQPTELVRQNYDDAISFLKDVAAARASLDQPGSSQTPQSSAAGPEISTRDANLRFSDCQIKGFA